jgi:hypothetical protein
MRAIEIRSAADSKKLPPLMAVLKTAPIQNYGCSINSEWPRSSRIISVKMFKEKPELNCFFALE